MKATTAQPRPKKDTKQAEASSCCAGKQSKKTFQAAEASKAKSHEKAEPGSSCCGK
ncbi:MAG: hypothetical protein HY243_10375 [Proteobacteria bacterium]|nr:hypothetical protein [Pseudomonadota bacterium]